MTTERIKELEEVLEKLTTNWSGYDCKTVDNKGVIFFYIHGSVMNEAIKVLKKSFTSPKKDI